MTDEEFQAELDKALTWAEEYHRKLDAGEIEPLKVSDDEIKTWPFFEMSLTEPHPTSNFPVKLRMTKQFNVLWSPMEYSHDDKDKGTE